MCWMRSCPQCAKANIVTILCKVGLYYSLICNKCGWIWEG